MAYDENIDLVPPVRGLVEVSRGVELWGVVIIILSLQFWNTWDMFADIENLFYAVRWWDNLDATQYWGGSSGVSP